MAMVMAGATVVSNYGIARDVRMVPGGSADVGDYTVVFNYIGERQGPNFTAQYGEFDVFLDGRQVASLHPEKRNYPVGMSVMTEADIDAGFFRDVFVAIGERISDEAWAIRLQYKPLVRWLWLGSLIMAIGGFLAIADKRYRIRVKAKAAASSGENAQPVGAKPSEAGT
jgi:cytochrome c-type biogenesis protein CcmF